MSCGSGSFFMPKFRNVGRVALPPPIRLDVCQGEAEEPAIKSPCHCEEAVRAKKGRPPLRKRPNTIILPRHPGNVNCNTVKSYGFYLLYHLTTNYLLEIPSCKNVCGMIDCCHKRGGTRRGTYTCRLGSTSSVLHIREIRRMLKNLIYRGRDFDPRIQSTQQKARLPND